MILDLLLIGLAITLNPLPLMAFVLLVASARGAWKGLTFILGWLACLVAVIAIVLAITGGHPPPPKSPPSTAVLALKLAIGVSLVGYGEYRRRRRTDRSARGTSPADGAAPAGSAGTAPASPAARPGRRSSSWLSARLDRTTVWTAAGLAVLLQPWGLVAAGATAVVEADTSHFTTWIALFSFCLLATASLLAAELYVVFAPTAARARLLAMRSWLEGHQDQAIVVLCLVVGLWFTGKSIYQLTG
ncbi:GAP family protein [Streptomyces tropicalis]|uniref:GAP family protein n=1 Tax=Streptomyces tropicalis TaxID=3034234 RepID=A0ABT6A6G9_9ACTN|nr:GAP family protein [Streptomyces tropicalis]MDF3300241.1 GAP family protein [Streptomyces tropicalis]